MSDEEIRRLERAFAADPSDAVGLERLAAARTRAGRGWQDEALLPDLRCSAKKRGVYVWTCHGLDLELVLVPACPLSDLPPSWAHAFWIGRYPVTLGEWAVRVWATRANEGGGLTFGRCAVSDESLLRHPVVNVTHEEALDFCAWAGLRLPTPDEWERAALGNGPIICPDCLGSGRQRDSNITGDTPLTCTACGGPGRVPRRRYPWGNEPPTPERCVAVRCLECGGIGYTFTQDMSGNPPEQVRCEDCYAHDRPAHVPGTRPVRHADGRPTRPLGASPYDAHDMVGHVAQYTNDGFARGSSFRSVYIDGGRITGPRNGDDVGFRVALGDVPDRFAFGGPLRRPEPPPVTEFLDPVVLVEQRGRSTPSVWRRPKRGRTRRS